MPNYKGRRFHLLTMVHLRDFSVGHFQVTSFMTCNQYCSYILPQALELPLSRGSQVCEVEQQTSSSAHSPSLVQVAVNRPGHDDQAQEISQVESVPSQPKGITPAGGHFKDDYIIVCLSVLNLQRLLSLSNLISGNVKHTAHRACPLSPPLDSDIDRCQRWPFACS